MNADQWLTAQMQYNPKMTQIRYANLMKSCDNMTNQTLASQYRVKLELFYGFLTKKAEKPSITSTDLDYKEVVEDPEQVKVCKKLVQLYRSSIKRNIAFDLTYSDVRKLLRQRVCFYTGNSFVDDTNDKRTIDRVDHLKGYTKNNVVACTHSANQMKNHIFEKQLKDSGNLDTVSIYKIACRTVEHLLGE